MDVGIIGFARSGKTTLFNVLTSSHAAVGAFGNRDANVSVIKVPDERVDGLNEICRPKRKAYAEIQFVDVAPSESAGVAKALDSAALNVLKNVDALVHVVRAFENEEVAHPLGGVDPVRDCKALEEELLLSDLLIIEKRLERLEKEHGKDRECALLERCREMVESGSALRGLELAPQEERDLAGFCFLSRKPLLLVGNYGEEALGRDDPARLEAFAAEQGRTHIDFCGELETEVAELPEDERGAFRDELGLGEDSRSRFVRAAYDALGLISFLTFNEKEVRAWSIPKGTKAVDAAGVVHSDIQRGFIRAEVVRYDDFVAAGSMAKAKEQGHVRVEGKDHIVHDGDIILFRFNV